MGDQFAATRTNEYNLRVLSIYLELSIEILYTFNNKWGL